MANMDKGECYARRRGHIFARLGSFDRACNPCHSRLHGRLAASDVLRAALYLPVGNTEPEQLMSSQLRRRHQGSTGQIAISLVAAGWICGIGSTVACWSGKSLFCARE